jgi:signal transduction histidine kinase
MTQISPADEADPVIATAPPVPSHSITALMAAVLVMLPTALLWGQADVAGPELPAAIAIYQSSVIWADLLTAVLLAIQFRQLRTADLLVLSCTYLATALLAGVQLLSFPNVVAATGAIGGTAQTTPWLWNFWHLAFPLGVIGYAATSRRVDGRLLPIAAAALVATLVLVAGAVIVATHYSEHLPNLIDGTAFTAWFQYVNYPAMTLACLAAAAAVIVKRPRSAVSLWLAVSVAAFALDVVNNWHSGARYAIGWYVGRASGLVSSLLLLMVFVFETAFLLRYVSDAAQRLKLLNRDLVKALEAAKAADTAKSRFFAAASHDLRQPFQAMRLFHGVLDGQIRDERQRPVIERLGQALTAGEGLLTSLLDVARLDSGTVTVTADVFDLGALVAEVTAGFEPVAADKGLALRVAAPVTMVRTDPTLMRRVVSNLVCNALRYTERGGVLATVRRRRGRIFIEVWDTGVGIADDAASLIFEEFYQAGNPDRDRAQGLGLGLAIVQRLCTMMGCRVSLSSRLGKGSVFRVELSQAAETLEAVTFRRTATAATA